jgi:hypothetical protein
MAAVVGVVGVVALTVYLPVKAVSSIYGWWRGGGDDQDEARRQKEYNADLNTSNLHNNHDHLKHMHPTQDSAEYEVRRMRESPHLYFESERLNVYYNQKRGGWFVGKKRR